MLNFVANASIHGFIRYLLICMVLLCSACQPSSYTTQAYVFGTLVEIHIEGVPHQKAERASNAVLSNYQRWHQRLHAWQKSELQLLNSAIAAQPNAPTTISIAKDLSPLLKQAQALSSQSQQLFNPAIGHLIALWGFQRDELGHTAIDIQVRDKWLAKHPNMQDLEIYPSHIISHNSAVQLDLGGYAKGYALDVGLALLKQHGIQHALINIGGNVIALGQRQGRPWRVGIQHPRQPNAIAALDLPNGWAIGTSGDYQRYYIHHGERYCHIIDPSNGNPVQHMQAVTVLIPAQTSAGVLSDVASKPIFISPVAKQAEMAKHMGITHYLLIDAQGKVTVSTALAKRLIWLDDKAKLNAKIQ